MAQAGHPSTTSRRAMLGFAIAAPLLATAGPSLAKSIPPDRQVPAIMRKASHAGIAADRLACITFKGGAAAYFTTTREAVWIKVTAETIESVTAAFSIPVGVS